MAEVSVVIPNHKEDPEVLEGLVERLRDMFMKQKVVYEIIVQDDALGRGYGWAIKEGIRKARFGWILIMDGDGTYDPFQVPQLLRECPYSDVVIGERRGTVTASGFPRSIARWIIKKYAVMRTGFPIRDLNSGFRMFRREFYEEISHTLPLKFSLSSTMTLLGHFKQKAYDICPIPI